jgi:glycosyltransferase involved in cell wall biosynthesis
MNHRLAIVTGIPAPHQDPLYQHLANRSGITLKVFYCSRGHARTGWEVETRSSCFPHEFLRNWAPPGLYSSPFIGSINPGILAALRDFAPTYVVLNGYSQLTHWLAYSYCQRHGIPFALRGDSSIWLDDADNLRAAVRRTMLRHLVRRAAAILPIGTANQAYWQRYGAREEQLCLAPFAVDNRRIQALAQPIPRSARQRFVYVGRLLEHKGVDLLLQAFEIIRREFASELVIVGDGGNRSALEKLQSSAARRQTRWTGRLRHEEALCEMAAGHVFAFPSRREPWGMAINEAMATGLPVIAGKECGAAVDLVDHRTGWLLPELTTPALVSAMRDALEHPERTARMGEAARSRVDQWSLQRAADGFLAALAATPPVSRKARGVDWRVNPLISGRCPAS